MALRFRLSNQQRLSIVAVVFIALALGMPSGGYAASPEQRCNALGGACLCSEPLEMTDYTVLGGGFHYNPNDSTTKQCSGESNDNGVIQRNGSAPMVGNDPLVLAAMPAGRTVQRYMRGADGHTGIYQFDHNLASGDPRARVAVRWYVYLSPNYEFADKGNPAACQNSMKWFSVWHSAGNSTQWDTANGANSVPLIYAWTTSGGPAWTPSLDCCNFGPGWANQASIDPLAQFTVVGHWYRYEVILRNQTGAPGAILQAFRKDVTANTPEVKIIDTTVACAGCGTTQDWSGGSGATTALTPPGGSPLTAIEVNLFRNAGTNGSCAGYRAYSYILVAAWGTDAGQRIGAAAEIEGGAVTSPSPSPPGSVGLR